MNRQGTTSPHQTWIVGTLSFPHKPNDVQIPEIIIWMSDEGYVLNAIPCEVIDADNLTKSFETTVSKPQIGEPGWPASIRTASDVFAKWLRAYLGTRVPIIVVATPEIETASRLITDFGSETGGLSSSLSYLTSGITAEQMSGFFESAAELYRAQPWRIVKYDTDVFCLRAPGLDAKDLAVIVIGQNRQSYGVLLFADYEKYNQYVALAKAHAAGNRVTANVCFVSLNFEHARALDPMLRAEVKRYGWKVAGPAAYPWPIAVAEGWVSRPPSMHELKMLDVLAQALPRFLQDSRRFQAASVTRVQYSAQFHLTALGKPVDVEFEFPHPAESGDDAA